jgi:hypothetical protein
MVVTTKRVLIPLLLVVAIGTASFVASETLAAGGAARPLGIAAPGDTSFEFIGKLDQPDLNTSNFYGYLTHIVGIPDSQLFTSSTRADSTARLTFYVTATLDAHLAQLPLFVTTGAGTIRFYFNPSGGAKIDDPASFQRGRPVGAAVARFHDVLNAQSDTAGIENATGSLVQSTAGTFTLGGKSYRFGRLGLRLRIAMSGEGIRTVSPLTRTVIAAGDTTVTG